MEYSRQKMQEVLARVRVQSETDRQSLAEATEQAMRIYGSSLHWTGETLLDHTVGVVDVLLPFEPDIDALVACILHHVLQFPDWTLARLDREYGTTVQHIVRGVHLLSHVTMKDRRMSMEHLRSMLLKVSDDMRVVLMILCDRSYVMAHLKRLAWEEQRRLSDDALHLFAPVAARLGIYTLKHALEGCAFPVAYPVDAERIREQLQLLKKNRGVFLEDAAKKLTVFLRSQGIHARVCAREKESYSIFTKMRTKTVSAIIDIYDLFALRVIVGTLEQCYQALGLLHGIGHPVQQRFKDYIAFPKPNGYQSLHTNLMNLPGIPEGVMVEVQIRTEEMHREAELGIAAHWRYKEGGAAEKAVQRKRLQSVLVDQEPVSSAEESVLQDHIFVLTPKGDIIELPEEATPLDFAFHVHSSIGLHCRFAKVNGTTVPLDKHLENGDIIEIVKGDQPSASSRWMTILKVASARAKLRKYLLAAKHAGFLKKESIIPVLQEKSVSPKKEKRPRMQHKDALIELDGGVPMPFVYARCCNPNEGVCGAIAGVITRSGEVKVHRQTCRMLKNVNPERRIGVQWRE